MNQISRKENVLHGASSVVLVYVSIVDAFVVFGTRAKNYGFYFPEKFFCHPLCQSGPKSMF